LPNPQKTGDIPRLTATDIAIVECLSRDARMAVSSIADALKLPASTVRHRLNRLVRNEILQFAAVTDPLKLGYPVWVLIGLHVELERVRNVADRLAVFDEVYFIGIATGGYEIILSAIFRSTDELANFLINRLPKIPGIIKASTYQYLAFTKRQMNLPPLPPQAAAEVPSRGSAGRSARARHLDKDTGQPPMPLRSGRRRRATEKVAAPRRSRTGKQQPEV
jgi:Lrp/AsnC family transcriptional regulator for asnA, asnC and gidA